MNSFSMSEVRALMAAIERIHATPRMEAFSGEVFHAIGELIPDVFLSLDQLNMKTGEVNHSANNALAPEILAKVIELLPTHPVMPAALADFRGAIRVTDCITQRQFRQTPHYNEYMRHLGLEYQTVVTLDIPGHIAGITVNREADFTDKKSTFLTLLAPHLALASGKLKRLETLQKALDSIPFPTAEKDFRKDLHHRREDLATEGIGRPYRVNALDGKHQPTFEPLRDSGIPCKFPDLARF
jgi:hypothetical protein